MFRISVLLFFSFLPARQSLGMNDSRQNEDPYLWLEEVESERALGFAREANAISTKHLENSPHYKGLEKEIRTIALAKDRQPNLEIRKGVLYNFWQDDKHVRGIWRKTSIESYKSGKPKWDVLIDLDRLSQAEGENWVWQGAGMLKDSEEHALISLSRGGKDASVTREFNLKTRQFVPDGFILPEAKGGLSWIDRDTVYVATDFGPGSMTDSGYPRIVKRWKRGTPLSDAVEIFSGKKTDIGVSARYINSKGGGYTLVHRGINFYEQESFYLDHQGELVPSPLPQTADLRTSLEGWAFFEIKEDLGRFKSGSVVALKVTDFKLGARALDRLELVFEPTEKRFVNGVYTSESQVLMVVSDNILTEVVKVERAVDGKWLQREISLGKGDGMASISSLDEESDLFLMSYAGFLTPNSIYLANASDKNETPKLLDQAPKRFDASGMQVERFQAQSKDGTMIPYFKFSQKGLKKSGFHPTVIYGYGGFELPMQPYYMASVGKAWVEKGGVYILANLRGGGELVRNGIAPFSKKTGSKFLKISLRCLKI